MQYHLPVWCTAQATHGQGGYWGRYHVVLSSKAPGGAASTSAPTAATLGAWTRCGDHNFAYRSRQHAKCFHSLSSQLTCRPELEIVVVVVVVAVVVVVVCIVLVVQIKNYILLLLLLQTCIYLFLPI